MADLTQTAGTTPAYLIAGSIRDAHATASIDWGWERIGKSEYRTPDGATVEVIATASALRGRRSETLYLGHGWNMRRDTDEIVRLIEKGYVVVSEGRC